METSRVFIKGLPPTLSEDDFKSHFSKRHQVTDVKLMPQRRIGYVGYKTAEDAKAAVKYFNKSFLRMSKLHVEPAFGFSATGQSQGQSQHRPEAFKKRENQAADAPSTTNKRRRSDTQDVSRITKALDDKRSKHNDDQSSASHHSRDQGEQGGMQKQELDADEVGRELTKHDTEQSQDPTVQETQDSTDVDWMRSRTSRLLGLIDDDADNHTKGKEQDASISDGEHIESKTSDQAPEHQHEPRELNDEPSPNCVGSQNMAQESRRLFLRNLAYTTSEDDLKPLLASYGMLSEIQVPHDFKTGESKGFAFAEFEDAQSAQRATQNLDGTTFQGRLLHVLPATPKRKTQLDEFAIAQLPLKKRRLIERKQNASSSTFNWNSMFMNADAVLSSTAARLGVAKSEVFDPTSSDAAVNQAQAETNTIQATKKYFEQQGVNLDSFSSSKRNGRALLVKNFKYDTSLTDLKKLFDEHDGFHVRKILMPPTGTIAIVELENEVQAASALRAFSYRKLKDSVLFLERAPEAIFVASKPAEEADASADGIKKDPRKLETNERIDDAADPDTSTLFVRNLNFTTTSERLREEFRSLQGFKSALVKTRADPKNEGKTLSMGFGFLEFQTHDHAKAALQAVNGHVLEGHELQLKASHKGNDAAADRRRDDQVKRQRERSSKVVVKNLPFEASRKDVRNLFKSYGQLRALRMPKKLNNTSRGYAFAQFKTPKEAENALNALSSTHLLGRRLVLHYAAEETEDPEEQISNMQRKVGKQSESIALQKLTASQRKKLNLDSNEAVEQ